MKTLSNDFITIQISDHGAELTSIVANDKAESARLRCRPTSIPFTGSRLSACSTVPATCIESMSGPVENVYVKFPSGLRSP